MAPTSTTATTIPVPALAGASTSEVSVPPGTATQSLLTGIRVSHQVGFDRVVFDFRGRAPGYRVGYVSRPILEDASGREVQVAGSPVLRVHLEHASDGDASGRSTYAGANDLRPDSTTNVVELVRAGGFEAVLTWVMGLKQQAPFRVQTLAGPPRLVVDVAAP